ncbi:MAG TPA: hypothetical protein VFP84_31995 [Kofleriaceae bacterium]|nr:hypothetical protein [Kofleriaceae bacterium]
MLLALGGAGCFTTTHRSASPPYVRSIGASFDLLAVETCEITRTEQTHYNLFETLFWPHGNNFSTTEIQLGDQTCHVAFIPLAVDDPAPEAAR